MTVQRIVGAKWDMRLVFALALALTSLAPWSASFGAERVSKKRHGGNAPNRVVYTVQRGGSLRNVANLYKLQHSEIARLNPGIKLDKQLRRGAKVVVYKRRRGVKSASVGYPDRGTLVGAVPMLEGPGRSLRAIPWKRWGTAHTVTTMDRLFRRWHRIEPKYPILVGNMSVRRGGRLSPHKSHRSGRDADLGYVQKRGLYKEYNWRVMSARNLDVARTWKLLQTMLASGRVERIFMDAGLERLIYRYARRHPGKYRRYLRKWFSSAKGSRKAVIQPARGHRDHMHVRFRCAPADKRCRSRR